MATFAHRGSLAFSPEARTLNEVEARTPNEVEARTSNEVERLRKKHQNRVPVVCIIPQRSNDANPAKSKSLRLLCPSNMTGLSLRKIVLERLEDSAVDRLCVGGRLLRDDDVISVLDAKHCQVKTSALELTFAEQSGGSTAVEIDACSAKATTSESHLQLPTPEQATAMESLETPGSPKVEVFHLPECDPAPSESSVSARAGASQKRCDANANVASKLLRKHPDRVPIVCKQAATAASDGGIGVPGIERKMLAPRHMQCSELKAVIRKFLTDKSISSVSWEKMELFAEGNPLKPSTRVEAAYDKHKAEDGLLHVAFATGPAEALERTAAALRPSAEETLLPGCSKCATLEEEVEALKRSLKMAEEGSDVQAEISASYQRAMEKAEEEKEKAEEEKESTVERAKWSAFLQEKRVTEAEEAQSKANEKAASEARRAEAAEALLAAEAQEKESLAREKESLEKSCQWAEAAWAARLDLAREELQAAEEKALVAQGRVRELEQAATQQSLVAEQRMVDRVLAAEKRALEAETRGLALVQSLQEKSGKLSAAEKKIFELQRALEKESARSAECEERALQAEGWATLGGDKESEMGVESPVVDEICDEFCLVDPSDQNFPEDDEETPCA